MIAPLSILVALLCAAAVLVAVMLIRDIRRAALRRQARRAKDLENALIDFYLDKQYPKTLTPAQCDEMLKSRWD